MSETILYINKRNEHKVIELKRYSDGHYYWRQMMIFPNGVVNYVGSKSGRFFRVNKSTFLPVLTSDYE